MLERQISANGVVTYVSSLLRVIGVPHAFSTRLGGTSPRPFDSLNLGNPNGFDVQDDYQRIWENSRLLQQAARCASRELCRLHQVHGASVVRVRRSEAHDNSLKADALVSDDPLCLLSIRVADCAPVLLSSDDGRIVGAIHAGWRGVVGSIVTAAVEDLTSDRSIAPRSVVAAIGPCIGSDAFEVGEEVLDEFARVFGSHAPLGRNANGKGFVDLREAVRRQLLDAGLSPDHIDTTDRCTWRDADEFFSHRRDKGLTGRMAAIIGPHGAPSMPADH